MLEFKINFNFKNSCSIFQLKVLLFQIYKDLNAISKVTWISLKCIDFKHIYIGHARMATSPLLIKFSTNSFHVTFSSNTHGNQRSSIKKGYTSHILEYILVYERYVRQNSIFAGSWTGRTPLTLILVNGIWDYSKRENGGEIQPRRLRGGGGVMWGWIL